MAGASLRSAPLDPVLVGRIVRPHGLRGEVVIEPMDPASAHYEPGSSLWLAGRWMTIDRARATAGRWVVKFESVAVREAAEKLRGLDLVVDATELLELENDRFYVHDLVGCKVVDSTGADLGEIIAVIPGPRECLEIERGGERSLMPMTRAWLKSVDMEARRIVMDPPPGLAEITRDSGPRKPR